MKRVLILLALLTSFVTVDAQVRVPLWRIRTGGATNPIAASRLPTSTTTLPNTVWAAAGASTATMAASRPRCTTGTGTSVIAAYTGTAATINTAISGCDANHSVELGTGTFTLSTGVDFGGKSNVTLKGNGPANTILVFSDYATCGGIRGTVCVEASASNFTPSGEQNVAAWTSGYSKGATTITIGANTTGSTKPFVGATLILDQLNDADSDTFPDVWVCDTETVCSDEGGGGNAGRSGRGQHQQVTVTAVTDSVGGSCTGAEECTVTITPGLYHPNWRSGQTPGAWWADSAYITGVGIEALKLDAAAVSCGSPDGLRGVITFYNATNSWAKNVETDTGCRAQIMLFQAHHITIRDSYIHESHAYSSQCYGIEWYVSDDNLIENNIVHYVVGSLELNSGVGNVIAYNYLYDNHYTTSPTFMQAGNQQHTVGNNFNLIEGNDTQGLKADAIHGTSNWETWFRNRAHGWETGKTANTYPVQAYFGSRFFNAVGNVLGTDAYHTSYATTAHLKIYDLGADPDGGGPIGTDSNVAATMLRWGNYDTVNDAVRWESSEVPSGLSVYANPVPSSQTLPSSLYLSAKPSFFKSLTYPPIGPEVTGGDLSGVGGRAHSIPARACYDLSAKSSGFLTAFDGSVGGACY
jgi:hypothetical protein